MRTKHVIYAGAFLHMMILLSALTGCIATSTFPLRAKPGETIALTIGRTADEVGEGVTKDNLVVTITDVNGVDHVLDKNSTGVQGTIRSVFRSFPDPLSYPTGYPSGQVGAILDLPTDLAVGSAKVRWRVLDNKLPQYAFYFWPLGNFANNINLEVLSGGPGTPHVFQERSAGVGSLDDLKPGSRILFKLGTAMSNIGALQVQLNINPGILEAYIGYSAKIARQYQYQETNLSINTYNNSTSTYSHQNNIQLMNAGGKSKEYYRFYMVAQGNPSIDLNAIEGVTINPQDTASGTLDSNHFAAYDLNGSRITDATMTLKVFY